MIKNIYVDGDLSSLKTNREYNVILNELDQDEKQYIVGVDYAGLYSKDKSIVSMISEDGKGNFVVEGIREFDVERDVNATVIHKRR